MSYQGASITDDNERSRAQAQSQNQRSAIVSQINTADCVILSFWPQEHGNLVDILTDDGLEYTRVRLRTPLPFVLMHYGDTEHLTNVPATATFVKTPEDGYVELGTTRHVNEAEHSRKHYEPFYL